MQEPLRLGIAGLGTVGASVVRLLERHGDALAAQLGRPVRVAAVSARDRGRDRGFRLDGIAWHDDPVGLARSNSIDVFVELIGGADGAAHDSVRAALEIRQGRRDRQQGAARRARRRARAGLPRSAARSSPSRRRSAAASRSSRRCARRSPATG